MSVLIGDELVAIQKRLVDKFRPLKWRKFITPNTSLSPFVDVIEHQKRVDFAEIRPIGPQNTVWPLPTEERTAMRTGLVEFGTGLRVMDDELGRAAEAGLESPAATRAAANQKVTEQLLDRIAAVGYTDLGLYGLLNQPDVTPITINGNWDGSTADQILADLNEVVDTLVDQVDGILTSTIQITLPRAALRIASRKIFQTNSPDTVLQVFLRQNPGVVIEEWSHTVTAGTNVRIAAWFTGDSDVAEMFLPRDLTFDTPIRIARGYETAMFLKVGGVYSLYPQGICYADGPLS